MTAMSTMARRRANTDTCREWALNKWLNLSQEYLAREIGEERVNELVVRFKRAVEEDPELWSELYRANDPFRWLYERLRH